MSLRVETDVASRPPGPGGGALGAVSGAAGALFGSSMLRYVARRVLWGVFLLLVVSAITFLIFYAFPSADPAALRAGRQATPQLIEQIRDRRRTLDVDVAALIREDRPGDSR